MLIFATPDFGASAGMALILLILWVAVLVLVGVGIILGIRLLHRRSPKSSKHGVLLVVVCGMIPFFCCLAPPHIIRIFYGNYPIGRYPDNKITGGMTADEVQEILGRPHERYEQGDGESWYYWIDSYGISYFGVRFGQDGRVKGTHGN